jgi:hypothetical protein
MVFSVLADRDSGIIVFEAPRSSLEIVDRLYVFDRTVGGNWSDR